MKKTFFILMVLLLATGANAQWKPAGDRIRTEWGDKVDPESVLPEYPRPQLERNEWKNLNGLWEYAIKPAGELEPESFDGQILVPFAVESSLSGVQQTVGTSNELWYKRTFTVPSQWKNKDIILHFGAVDWRSEIYINDIMIGTHEGGYTPFSFNITPYLEKSGAQKVVLKVWDPSEKGYQSRGKQTSRPNHIWYTAVTGIWQTVWMEPVNPTHITAVISHADIETNVMNVKVNTSDQSSATIADIRLLDKGKVVASGRCIPGKTAKMRVKDAELWCPENPYLYDLEVSLTKDGKELDKVKSYTAFRKISLLKDAYGITRMALNNKPLFQYGPLDQGWWPDGLYTAPSDEALAFDIRKTKDWGFNMIRKHMKVEPARWYYHCDKEGMLVWQDMPISEAGGSKLEARVYNGGTDKIRSQVSKDAFYKEWKEVMDFCMPFQSVVVWVIFNEGAGQFETEKIAGWTKDYDPSRLVNPASGGNHHPCGDIMDLHNYPDPQLYLFDPQRATVLGEYGGIGLPVENHLWSDKKNWGYTQYKNKEEVTAKYVEYAEQLKKLVPRGFSGAVYTQTTDVEGEVNGLITYDRKVVKIDEAKIKAANQAVIREMNKE